MLSERRHRARVRRLARHHLVRARVGVRVEVRVRVRVRARARVRVRVRVRFRVRVRWLRVRVRWLRVRVRSDRPTSPVYCRVQKVGLCLVGVEQGELN